MNHQDAVEQLAVEKYLLDELLPTARDEFEAHFFECRACAAELKATAAFLGVAKQQLSGKRAEESARPARRVEARSWFEFLWRPAVLSPAFAVLLLILGYQNLVIHPRISRELAQLRSPEVLPSVSLVNSRAGGTAALRASATQSFLLPVDIPTLDRYASYACELVAPSGAVLWRVPVSAEQAKNTVSIRVPPGDRERGTYSLVVRGYADSSAGQGVEVTRYRFTLNNPD